MEKVDLANYQTSPDNFETLELLLTVKSFKLQEIRKRYLESRKRSRSGSIKRRKPAQGGLIYIKIDNGKIAEKRILAKYREARGLDFKDNKLAISSENQIYIFNINQNKMAKISHPWLSYIHTVKFNDDCSRLLVASSGVDTIMEFNIENAQKVWEWNAWEEGINKGRNPETGEEHYLTRSKKTARDIKNSGKNVILIQNPQKDKLPTALRAAFINSAEYDENGDILATFFHEGAIKKISKRTKKMESLITGFNKPHGGLATSDGYIVTDTAGGRIFQEKGNRLISYYFNNLKDKDPRLEELEWLQTSHLYKDLIITIDSNRTSFVIFSPEEKQKLQVPYNSKWAVQDFIDIKGKIDRIENAVQELNE